MAHWTVRLTVALAIFPSAAIAQTNCEGIPRGPERTDCYLALSQFYRAQSDLAAARALAQSDAACIGQSPECRFQGTSRIPNGKQLNTDGAGRRGRHRCRLRDRKSAGADRPPDTGWVRSRPERDRAAPSVRSCRRERLICQARRSEDRRKSFRGRSRWSDSRDGRRDCHNTRTRYCQSAAGGDRGPVLAPRRMPAASQDRRRPSLAATRSSAFSASWSSSWPDRSPIALPARKMSVPELQVKP